MKFDWYEATIGASPEAVVARLRGQAGEFADVRPARGATYGYERAYEVATGSRVWARVYYGGEAQGAGVHVSATGSDAVWFADMCRAVWRDAHEVTRLDVAEDYQGDGAFEGLSAICIDVAKARGVATFNVGDWAQGIHGRTLYVGSRTSVARVRCYEKGKEYLARGVRGFPLTATRVELMVRPKREGRRALAVAPPAECYGIAGWTRELYARLFAQEVARVTDINWTASDDDRALRWLVRQYGPLLGRQKEALGSWEAVGVLLGAEITGAGVTGSVH